jgi:hypothetical protein
MRTAVFTWFACLHLSVLLVLAIYMGVQHASTYIIPFVQPTDQPNGGDWPAWNFCGFDCYIEW